MYINLKNWKQTTQKDGQTICNDIYESNVRTIINPIYENQEKKVRIRTMFINVALTCMVVMHRLSIEYIRRSEDKYSIKKDRYSAMIYKSQI